MIDLTAVLVENAGAVIVTGISMATLGIGMLLGAAITWVGLRG